MNGREMPSLLRFKITREFSIKLSKPASVRKWYGETVAFAVTFGGFSDQSEPECEFVCNPTVYDIWTGDYEWSEKPVLDLTPLSDGVFGCVATVERADDSEDGNHAASVEFRARMLLSEPEHVDRIMKIGSAKSRYLMFGPADDKTPLSRFISQNAAHGQRLISQPTLWDGSYKSHELTVLYPYMTVGLRKWIRRETAADPSNRFFRLGTMLDDEGSPRE